MSDSWLSNVLLGTQPFPAQLEEDNLIEKLLNTIDRFNFDKNVRRHAHAAAFDLLVAAEYYGFVTHTGWLYCAQPDPFLFYTYTNTCPRCVLDRRFEFHRSSKPTSASIGATTSRLLCRFLKILLNRNNIAIDVFRGREPVDALFIDRSTDPVTLFFAEIKASPLVTLPLTVPTQFMTTTAVNELDTIILHRETDLPALFNTELFIFVPQYGETGWSGNYYSLGTKRNAQDTHWAYQGINLLLDDPTFFENYFTFWTATFDSYAGRIASQTVYWLSNGCGQPVPRPEKWPRRIGTGYESVSDGKTSVGMDRTDDIKKATYQVLKLGAEGKPSTTYSYKTGIVSNIHAIRHFDEYLVLLKDIVWTREPTGEVSKAGDLAPETTLFNLFDGIVTLTVTVARDTWIKTHFNW